MSPGSSGSGISIGYAARKPAAKSPSPLIIDSHWRPSISRMSNAILWPSLTNAVRRRSTRVSSGRLSTMSPGGSSPSLVLCEARVIDAGAGQDRRARVVGVELAQLPLARQHPETVAHLGAQRPVEALCPWPALDAIPLRDRRQDHPVQGRGHVGDDADLSHRHSSRSWPRCSPAHSSPRAGARSSSSPRRSPAGTGRADRRRGGPARPPAVGPGRRCR